MPSSVRFGENFDELRLAAAQAQLSVVNPVYGRIAQRRPTDDVNVSLCSKA
jgi:hypothetical protein